MNDPGNLLDKGEELKIGTTYNVTNRQNLMVSIRPNEQNKEAKYSFEYWTDAPDANVFDQLGTWLDELSGGLLALFIICIVCCVGLCGGCIYICARTCCKCGSKINPEYMETDVS